MKAYCMLPDSTFLATNQITLSSQTQHRNTLRSKNHTFLVISFLHCIYSLLLYVRAHFNKLILFVCL